MFSNILLIIAIILVFISVYCHSKAANNWMFNMIDESILIPLEEKKFTKIGWAAFILAAVLGFFSFYISN